MRIYTNNSEQSIRIKVLELANHTEHVDRLIKYCFVTFHSYVLYFMPYDCIENVQQRGRQTKSESQLNVNQREGILTPIHTPVPFCSHFPTRVSRKAREQMSGRGEP